MLEDATAISQHNDAYCERLMMCSTVDECPAAPNLDLDGARVAYVYAERSGCYTEVMITEVLDCGDEVEVHYSVLSDGICTAFYEGWDAVLIPDGAPVTFVEHE